MISKIFSAAVWGLDALPVEVEADLAPGLPQFVIVGLPDKAVQESRKRVQAALENSGYDFPRGKVTVNLAPADLKKIGPAYDLPIAVAVLSAAGMPGKQDLSNTLFCGELSLDGKLRPISGILPIALGARDHGFKVLVVPTENAPEASWVSGVKVYGVNDLPQLVTHLTGQRELEATHEGFPKTDEQFEFDFAYIAGQEQVKRGLEVAAAGAHNLLMIGPPGGGKTLLARALPSILPTMTEQEILEVSKIYSIAGMLGHAQPLIFRRPFRSPHHSASMISLVGGGTHPKPGEISLADRGVLFMDEMPEFPRSVLESLRQPLEDGTINVARAAGSYRFPARFVLLGTANPCPCGYLSDPTKACRCTTAQIINYNKKISGPLLDRIDIHLEVPKVPLQKLAGEKVAEESAAIRERVESARKVQIKRQGKPNGELTIAKLKQYCRLAPSVERILQQASSTLGLTARGYHKVVKLSRTIADLGNVSEVDESSVLEALQYRQKEQVY